MWFLPFYITERHIYLYQQTRLSKQSPIFLNFPRPSMKTIFKFTPFLRNLFISQHPFPSSLRFSHGYSYYTGYRGLYLSQ